MCYHVLSSLTCAGLDALDPRVLGIGAASTAAMVEPSTVGSAATVDNSIHVAGFLHDTALRALGARFPCYSTTREHKHFPFAACF